MTTITKYSHSHPLAVLHTINVPSTPGKAAAYVEEHPDILPLSSPISNYNVSTSPGRKNLALKHKLTDRQRLKNHKSSLDNLKGIVLKMQNDMDEQRQKLQKMEKDQEEQRQKLQKMEKDQEEQRQINILYEIPRRIARQTDYRLRALPWISRLTANGDMHLKNFSDFVINLFVQTQSTCLYSPDEFPSAPMLIEHRLFLLQHFEASVSASLENLTPELAGHVWVCIQGAATEDRHLMDLAVCMKVFALINGEKRNEYAHLYPSTKEVADFLWELQLADAIPQYVLEKGYQIVAEKWDDISEYM